MELEFLEKAKVMRYSKYITYNYIGIKLKLKHKNRYLESTLNFLVFSINVFI